MSNNCNELQIGISVDIAETSNKRSSRGQTT